MCDFLCKLKNSLFKTPSHTDFIKGLNEILIDPKIENETNKIENV